MKKRLFITILFVFSLIFLISPTAQANVNIYDIKIGPLNEAWVNISWSSKDETTGYIVFGEKPEELNFYVADMNLSRKHSADMTGLKKNQEYYFKVISVDKNGKESESFLNYLDTKNMKDSRSAKFLNFKKIQTTDNYFTASFSTDEKTRTELYYGDDPDNLNKSIKSYGLKTDHEIIIKNLQPNTRYYLKIIAKNEDGNLSSYYEDFKTPSHFSKEIQIDKLIPSSYGTSPLMPERALISFETNLLTSSEVHYGLKPKELKKRERISKDPALNHQIFLNDLNPDTIYFYQLKLRSEILKIDYKSPIYSFKTAPLTKPYLENYINSGDLVKYKSTTYLIYNENKVPLYNNNKIRDLNSEVKKIKESYINEYEEASAYWGNFHDGQVVKLKNKNTVYLIDGEYKRAISNWAVFNYLNYKDSDIIVASSSALAKYKEGRVVSHSKEISSIGKLNNTLAKSSNNKTIYLLINDKKLPFLNEASFNRNSYSFSEVKILDDNFLNSIVTGQVVI